MSELDDAFLRKARESLAGAESELTAQRHNNVANRCYYACFQAAIFALVRAGIRPSGRTSSWSHSAVQSQFAGVLIGQRKAYTSQLRDTLRQSAMLREQADYKAADVNHTQAVRALGRTRAFVAAIDTTEGEIR